MKNQHKRNRRQQGEPMPGTTWGLESLRDYYPVSSAYARKRSAKIRQIARVLLGYVSNDVDDVDALAARLYRDAEFGFCGTLQQNFARVVIPAALARSGVDTFLMI